MKPGVCTLPVSSFRKPIQDADDWDASRHICSVEAQVPNQAAPQPPKREPALEPAGGSATQRHDTQEDIKHQVEVEEGPSLGQAAITNRPALRSTNAPTARQEIFRCQSASHEKRSLGESMPIAKERMKPPASRRRREAPRSFRVF